MLLLLISRKISLMAISAFLLLLVALASLILILYWIFSLSSSFIVASLSFEVGKSILIYIMLSAHLVSELTILMYSEMRFSISFLFSCLFCIVVFSVGMKILYRVLYCMSIQLSISMSMLFTSILLTFSPWG